MTARDLAIVPIVVAFVACVVVPPPLNTAQHPTRPPVQAGSPYGGSSYGVSNCSGAYGGASYGGVAYGGASCSSWLSDTMPAVFGDQLGQYKLGIATMRGATEPCRAQMTYRGCMPAIGAIVTLTFSNGATLTGKTAQNGQYIFNGVTPGSYRLRVDYLGIALESMVTLDAAQAKAGLAMAASLSPNDFR